MSIVLIVEDGTGKEDANTFINLYDANAYFDARINNDAWLLADEDKRSRSLAQASRILSQYVKWLGWKTNENQALAFPRYGICYDGDRYYNCVDWWLTTEGVYSLPSDKIPKEIKEAQCELALVLLQQDTQSMSDTAGFSNISVAGTVDITIDKYDRIKEIPSHVFKIISHLGRRKGNTSRLVRS